MFLCTITQKYHEIAQDYDNYYYYPEYYKFKTNKTTTGFSKSKSIYTILFMFECIEFDPNTEKKNKKPSKTISVSSFNNNIYEHYKQIPYVYSA